jgi:hypothetical protein
MTAASSAGGSTIISAVCVLPVLRGHISGVTTFRRRAGRLLIGVLAVAVLPALASCGGSEGPGPGPTPTTPVVSSASPAAGSTSGGTLVTIVGANFVSGATVTIAGVAATDVTVQSATLVTALTGAHSAGSGDVMVTVAGRTGTLPNGYTYANPGPLNNPAPVISSLTTKSLRQNAPAQFAELGDDIAVSAAVSDSETPVGDLILEWTADAGTFTGTGPAVQWRAPTELVTPFVVTLKLTVIERYVTPDGLIHENRVERSATVNVHDTPKEVGDLAVQFLTDFSNSSTAPEIVVRNFSPRCKGTAAELEDVENNRKNYLINQYEVGAPTVTLGFGGVCSFRERAADACTSVPVRWDVTVLATGLPATTEGTDFVTAVYETDRWYLCDSDYLARSTSTLLHFKK